MSANVVQLDRHRDADDGGDDLQLALIEPGEYEAVYVGHACYSGIFGKTQQKIRVDFRLLAHPGVTLSRWYRAQHSRGRISAFNSSDIVRELSVVLGYRVRRDRVAVASLANIVARVKVHTVTRNRDQKRLHDINQYSVISELLGKAQ
jgi:hypothetical protein